MSCLDNYPFLMDYFKTGIQNSDKNIAHCILFWGNDIDAQYELALEISRLLNFTCAISAPTIEDAGTRCRVRQEAIGFDRRRRAHRDDSSEEAAVNARENGFGAIIAAAGMAAHLAGAIAANTTLPVIGIPCKSSVLDGMDALLATVQMPTGIPVATVAINGGANAALLAIQVLAVADNELAKKLDEKRVNDSKAVLTKDANLSL